MLKLTCHIIYIDYSSLAEVTSFGGSSPYDENRISLPK